MAQVRFVFLRVILASMLVTAYVPAAIAADDDNDSAVWPFSGTKLNKPTEEAAPALLPNTGRPLISGPEDMSAVAQGLPPAPPPALYEEIIPAAKPDNAPKPEAAPKQGNVAKGDSLPSPEAPAPVVAAETPVVAEPVAEAPAEKPALPPIPAHAPTPPPVHAPVPTSKPKEPLVPVVVDVKPEVAAPVEVAAPAPEPAVPVAATENSTLAPGAKLMLTVENDPTLNGPLVVSDTGVVALPLVGPLTLVGLTLADAEKQVVSAYANGYFIKPRLTLTRAQ